MEKAGPTGKFPQGKLTPEDEGELRMRLGVQNGKIVLDFGSPVVWVGMGPDDAAALAGRLMALAEDLKNG